MISRFLYESYNHSTSNRGHEVQIVWEENGELIIDYFGDWAIILAKRENTCEQGK